MAKKNCNFSRKIGKRRVGPRPLRGEVAASNCVGAMRCGQKYMAAGLGPEAMEMIGSQVGRVGCLVLGFCGLWKRCLVLAAGYFKVLRFRR